MLTLLKRFAVVKRFAICDLRWLNDLLWTRKNDLRIWRLFHPQKQQYNNDKNDSGGEEVINPKTPKSHGHTSRAARNRTHDTVRRKRMLYQLEH